MMIKIIRALTGTNKHVRKKKKFSVQDLDQISTPGNLLGFWGCVSVLLQFLHHNKPLNMESNVLSINLYMCKKLGVSWQQRVSLCSFLTYALINKESKNIEALLVLWFNYLGGFCYCCILMDYPHCAVCVCVCLVGIYISSILAFHATLTSILPLPPCSEIINPLLKYALQKSSKRKILTLKFSHLQFGQRGKAIRDVLNTFSSTHL